MANRTVVPFWLAGDCATGDDELSVTHPYDGAEVARVAVPRAAQVERAILAAQHAFAELRALPARVRADALRQVSAALSERSEEAAEIIVAESGKPLKWARAEVARSVGVFRLAAEEAWRLDGRVERLDREPAGDGRLAITRRFARGVVLGICPFNFPLNLVAHKVAPAIAIGAPIIVKPAPATPLSALFLAETLAATGLPSGSLSVLPLPNDRVSELSADSRLPIVSFTGSGSVGWALKESMPRKQVVLELGGNAAAVVCADADVQRAARRIAMFANYQAGQSCIAVQRVLAHGSVHDDVVAHLVREAEALVTGDPRDERVDVGPMINEAAALRVAEWVEEAVAGGAKLLTGGERRGSTFAPTVLCDVPPTCRLATEEVFGPVVTVTRFESFDEAISQVNASRFGLQAGIFTRHLTTAFRAYSELNVGGVIIDDVPSYRSDHLPYGGTKDSGVGREGVRSAMADFSDERVLVFSSVAL